MERDNHYITLPSDSLWFPLLCFVRRCTNGCTFTSTCSQITSQKERILKFLIDCKDPSNAYYIAKETGIGEGSVRGRLRDLVKEGSVHRPMRGFYQAIPIHGVGNGVGGSYGFSTSLFEPRIQNLCFIAKGKCDVSGVVDLPCESASVRVTFGKKRNNISVKVSVADGLDYDGFRKVVDSVDAFCESRGYIDLNWMVSSVEVLHDFWSYRIDGFSCFTLRRFDGVMEKLYDKGGRVRFEVKMSKPLSLEDVFLMLQGSAPPFDLYRRYCELSRENKELHGILRYYRYSLTMAEREVERLKALVGEDA